jgi:hypothetical protein
MSIVLANKKIKFDKSLAAPIPAPKTGEPKATTSTTTIISTSKNDTIIIQPPTNDTRNDNQTKRNHTEHKEQKPINPCAEKYISEVMGRTMHGTDKSSKKSQEEWINDFKTKVHNSTHCPGAHRDICHNICNRTVELKNMYIRSVEEKDSHKKHSEKEKENRERELDDQFVLTLWQLSNPCYTCKVEGFPKYWSVSYSKHLQHVQHLLKKDEKEEDDRKSFIYRLKAAVEKTEVVNEGKPTPDESDLIDIALSMFEIADDCNKQTDNGNKKNVEYDPSHWAKKYKKIVIKYDDEHSVKEPHSADDDKKLDQV